MPRKGQKIPWEELPAATQANALAFRERVKDREQLYSCSCGRTGTWSQMTGHQHGADKRPECQGGIRKIDASDVGAVGPSRTPNPLESEPVFRPHAYEYTGEPVPDDPDEIARRMIRGDYPLNTAPPLSDDWLRQLQTDADGGDTGDGAPPGRNGDFGGEDVGGGDWRTQPPGGLPAVSTRSESVILPNSVRIMYDWARANGWNQGDGSLSAFVTDILLDHWRVCWGKLIGVLDRSEVDVA